MGERSVRGAQERLVERKVRGGKLFRLRVSLSEGGAVSASLTGDFFLEPEDGIDALELALLDAYRAPGLASARTILDNATSGLSITGFSNDDLLGALSEAGAWRGG